MASYKKYMIPTSATMAKVQNVKKPSTTSDMLGKQISNYQTRLKNVGVDDKKDKRNFVEKLLNLPEGQNFLFDIFEILNRPQQAVFGGIKAAREGGSFLEGAKEGITGERKTSGKELLFDETPTGKIFEDGKFNLKGFLGLGADILLDPMNVALPGVGKIIQKGKTAADVSKGLKAVESTGGILKTADTLSPLLKGGTSLQKGANVGIETAKKIRTSSSLNELLMRGVGKTIKGGFKIGDVALEKGLGFLDSKKLASNVKKVEQVKELAEKGVEGASELLNKLNKKPDLLGTYKGLKKGISETFNYGKTEVGKLSNKLKTTKNEIDIDKDLFAIRSKDFLNNDVKKYATKNKMSVEQVDDLIGDVIESNMADKIVTGRDVLSKLSDKKGTFTGSPENMNAVTKMLDNLGLKYNIKNNNIKLDKSVKNITDIFNSTSSAKILDSTKFRRGIDSLGYTPDDITEILSLRNNPEFMKLVDKQKNIYKDFVDTIKTTTSGTVDFSDIIDNPGYIRRALNENSLEALKKAKKEGVFRGSDLAISSKQIGARKYDLPARVVNRQIAEKTTADLTKLAEKAGLTIDEFATKTPEDLGNLLSKTVKLPTKKVKEFQDKRQQLLNRITGLKEGTAKETKRLTSLKEQEFKTTQKLQKLFLEGNVKPEQIQKLKDKQPILADKIIQQQNAIDDLITTSERNIKNVDFKIDRYSKESDIAVKQQFKDKFVKDIEYLRSKEGQELFKRSASAGFGDFTEVYGNKASQIKAMNEAVLNTSFNDPSIAKIISSDDTVTKIGRNQVRIKNSDLLKKLDKFKNILPDETVNKFMKQIGDSDIALDKNIVNMLNVNFNKEELNPFLKMVDGINNTFKKFKVFTPGFQLRNAVGSPSNMYLSGMNASDILKYQKKSANIIRRSKEIWENGAKGIFKQAGDEQAFNLLKKYKSAGFSDAWAKMAGTAEFGRATKGIKGLGRTGKKNLMDWNNMVNNGVDQWYRLGLLAYADEHPKYLAKLGVNNAADAVKKVLFDPDGISPNEKNIITKIFPFYSFTKQNLMYQAENLAKNTPKYARLVKSFNVMYDSFSQGDEDAYQKWAKEGFLIPLPWKDEKGNRLTLKTNLPISDLGEFAGNPLRRVVASTTPLIKTPFEKVSGVDMFTGAPKDQSILQASLGAVGLDKLVDIPKTVEALKSSDKTRAEKTAKALSSIFQYADSEKIKNQRLFEEKEYYANMIKKLKEQGMNIPTITDINKAKRLTAKLAKQRKSYLQ